jgi:hypothetical protein
MATIRVSRKELEHKYTEEGMPIEELCKYYVISASTLYAMLDRLGIPRRLPRSGTNRPILVD